MANPFDYEDGYRSGRKGSRDGKAMSYDSGSGYGGRGGNGEGREYGGGSSYGSGRDGYGGGRDGYGGGRDGYGSGYGGGGGDKHGERPRDGYDQETRMMMAHQRMENSSAQCLRTLNETMRQGIDTTEELERQAESMDRTERMLDDMHQDLNEGEKSLRKIKSPFGGFFSRKKNIQEVVDPKACKSPAPSKSKSDAWSNQSKYQGEATSTGNTVVDSNMDEMEKVLFKLKGIGELMGDQLDDSSYQTSRVQEKLGRNHLKIEKLNRGIKRELN